MSRVKDIEPRNNKGQLHGYVKRYRGNNEGSTIWFEGNYNNGKQQGLILWYDNNNTITHKRYCIR